MSNQYPFACSTCYGSGYCVDGKSCPSGCRAPVQPTPAAPSDAKCTPAPWKVWSGNHVINEAEGQVCVCETREDAELIARLRNATPPAQSSGQSLEAAIDELIQAIEYTPLGVRSIKALANLRAALASQPSAPQASAQPAGAAIQALQKAYDALQQFKADWMRIPYYGDRVNKTIREGISLALGPIVNLDAVGGPLDAEKIRALAATMPSAAPSLPKELREFVEAIAHNFDGLDEDGERCCRGCSGLAMWDVEQEKMVDSHQSDCIVPRARALLAAAPSPLLGDAT